MNNQNDEKWGAAEHAVAGAGVGAAGVGSSVGLIGLSAGIAALPVSIVIGVVGGLAWWGIKKLTEDD
jgi:hypothetical protein